MDTEEKNNNKNSKNPSTFVSGWHDVHAVNKMQYRTLIHKTDDHPALVVSSISLGCGSLGSLYGQIDQDEGIRIVHECLKAGINFMDTAPWYGQGKSESLLGVALKGVPREAYYVSTKVGRYELDYLKMFDFSYDKTIQSVEESLKKLGVDYIDLIQIHDCEFAESLDVILKETLPALMTFVKSGKCRFIGITGYPLSMFKQLIEMNEQRPKEERFPIATILSYCHFTLYDSTLIKDKPFFDQHHVSVINAAPIAMGLLSDQGPQSWHNASPLLKQKCAEAAKHCKSQGVDIAKLAVYYSTHNENIPTTLVSSPKSELMMQNISTAILPSLSQHEQSIMEHIQQHFFKDLTDADIDWSDVEKSKYVEKLKKARDEATRL